MSDLSVALGDYPHVKALLSGDVTVAGHTVRPVEVKPIIGAYRRMIRDLEFDVCELAPVSYAMAVQAGVPLTAIPVYLNRKFHHADVQCGAASGVHVPKDLEGRRIGVRAYSVSTGVWVRGLLREDYGVDLGKITWVVDDEDHVEGRIPENVEHVTDGRSLGALLASGELDAALTGNAGTGRAGSPRAGWTAAATGQDGAGEDPYPLFAEPDAIARDSYLRTGVYPLHSVIALRSELVERDPDLPSALYAAFAESKRLQAARDPEWTALPRLGRQARLIGGDPVPYGIAPNEQSVRAALRFARDQGLLDEDRPGRLYAEGHYPDA
ncbi:4,5-dihydroxyphthalate decarboxylase [Streptomyces sp. NPDC050560]|uniref:4,5-dihydroxyphthalate decarboxylase n=1 Tax=Streptomyces sp. NPDC050560 TaxID=3365630 RepID=UPI0037887BC7